MYNSKLRQQQLLEYTKNIKLNVFYSENGEDIKNVMKEIIINNCNPIEKKFDI